MVMVMEMICMYTLVSFLLVKGCFNVMKKEVGGYRCGLWVEVFICKYVCFSFIVEAIVKYSSL